MNNFMCFVAGFFLFYLLIEFFKVVKVLLEYKIYRDLWKVRKINTLRREKIREEMENELSDYE